MVWNPKRYKSVVTTLIYCKAYLDNTTVKKSSGTTKTQVAESTDSQVAQTSFLVRRSRRSCQFERTTLPTSSELKSSPEKSKRPPGKSNDYASTSLTRKASVIIVILLFHNSRRLMAN